MVVVRHTPGDYPAGKQGDVFTAEFRVTRMPRCSSTKRRVRSRSRPMIRLRQTTCGARSSTMGACERVWLVQGRVGRFVVDHPAYLTAAIPSPDRAAATRAFEAMMA